jgi:hypothetical protein
MSRSQSRRRRRGPARILLAVAALLLAFGVTPGIGAGPAGALPPRCEDGSPPPCDVEPEPDPEPEPEPIPPTTRPNPPPTGPPTTAPPGPPWVVNVVELVQDPAGYSGSVYGERFWIQEPVLTQRSLLPNLIDLPTIWDPIPAGTANLVNGALSFPGYPLPQDSEMVLRVRENGSPGVLCRTPPRSALPPSGRPLHILAPRSKLTSAANLQAMVASIQGPVEGLEEGLAVDITSVTLTPQADGLSVRTQGKLTVDTLKFTFDHTMVFTLAPAIGTNLNYVLVAQAANSGTAVVGWDQTPIPGGDGLLELVRQQLPPRLRSQILLKATTLVNNHIHGLQEVAWWNEQGFTVSMRKVSYSAEGLTVYPSFCRLG